MASSSSSSRQIVPRSSLHDAKAGRHESEQQLLSLSAAAGCGWDIFLSHSGAQKGFVKGLFQTLAPPYNVFFDIDRSSLPLAEDFPRHIFHAAKTSKVAVVVLSNEFFSSKWPMLELSTFIDAMPSSGVKVLPLFYELSPQDLKDKEKLAEWHKEWEGFAAKDGRIKVSSWTHAVQRLSSINGLTFKKPDGELAYLHEIESAIYEMIPPRLNFSHAGVQGRDRLCKVLIDKFEELERRLQRQPSAADFSKVCVLGVYGLPGSGKTTLSACLCDHFSSTFAGRVLHLKLDSNPTDTQLLASAKELLKLTNFHQHKEKLMFHVENLPQMLSILQDSNLRSVRVFLVIDNISSQDSIESVQAILRLGVGTGSRVMLVARTMEVLRPLLDLPNYYHGHIQYVCDSMRVPSINEKEAIGVLMQPIGGLALASNNYGCEIEEETFSSSHQEILIKLTRLCKFHAQPPCDTHQGLLYLPLALKIIGSQLRSNGLDLEKWERQSSQLETMVEELKGDAVRMMVEKIFENLQPEKLKLIFLDVALFLVRPCCVRKIKHEEAIELLSFMHECSPNAMKRQVDELIRLCFLELGSRNLPCYDPTHIGVHDVFLEFARSVPHASSMYSYCRGSVHKSKADLRVLILEVDEKCERFDFPAGLSSVVVVVVRNGKSLAVLGLAGLTSLVSLEVNECPRLRSVEFDPAHARTLKRVKWAKQSAGQAASDHAQLLQGSFLQSLLQTSREGSAMQADLQLMYKGWWGLSDDLSGRWRPRMPLNGAMSQLKALQVLRLQGTGISSLRDLSSLWPQLRVLEVLEDRLEEIELGNLPKLKQFFFGHFDVDRRLFIEHRQLVLIDAPLFKSREPRMPKKPNLLAGCPELEDVRICLPLCEDGMGSLVIPSPNVQRLWLKHIHNGEPVLPDFTSSAHSLEEMHVCDHRVIQSIGFPCQFRSLVRIQLHRCPRLVEVIGLECLPQLRELEINECCKLQALGKLEAVRMLERLYLGCCPALILTSRGLSTLEFLKVIRCDRSPNVQFLWSDLENLTTLTRMSCTVFGNRLKLEKLVNLKWLQLDGRNNSEGQAASHERLSLCCYINGGAICDQVPSTRYVPLLLSGESVPAHLSGLYVHGVQDLVSLDGIHCLLTLECLRLKTLPKLASLQGLQSLTHLRTLIISDCMAVKELPSLCTLVNVTDLHIVDCVYLKSLEGCDKLRSLECAIFDGCKNLEHCPLVAEQLSQHQFTVSFSFEGCKFASIEAMVGWLVDEDAEAAVSKASMDGLVWKLSYHLLEKPAGETRMQVAEQVVETLAACLARKLPALTLDTCFNFRPWVNALKAAWRYELPFSQAYGQAAPSFPRGMERLLQGLGRVPVRVVLEQCQSDAQFRASVANCLLQTNPRVLLRWPDMLRERSPSPPGPADCWRHCSPLDIPDFWC